MTPKGKCKKNTKAHYNMQSSSKGNFKYNTCMLIGLPPNA